MSFCHLHLHSAYSFLDSTLRIEEIVDLALKHKMPAVALTDTNGLYGAVAFYKACREAGIKPILGAEVDDPHTHERAVVLARNFAGYSALCALLTRRHMGARWDARTHNGATGLAELEAAENDEPMFCGLNAEREPHSHHAVAPEDVAFDLREALRATSSDHLVILTDAPRLTEALAGRPWLYAELIVTPARRRLCRELYDKALHLGVPLVASGDVHFATTADHATYRILRAIHYGATVDRLRSDQTPRQRDSAHEQARPFPILPTDHAFEDDARMRARFKGLREAVDATAAIAEACTCELPLGQWKIPRPPQPDGQTPLVALRKIAIEGIKQRYRPLTRPAIDRLRRELEVIDRLGFCDYFLTVHAIAQAARRRGFPILGRGSGANSIVSYALGFTGVDPIRHDLYFERFLNPQRSVPPDIDLDFAWQDRDEILDWTYQTFGRDRVAMICATVTLQGRQAIREVGKALGLAEREVNRFTRPMPGYFLRHELDADLPAAYPECRGLPIDEEPWRTVLGHARRIIDLPRHLSIHCGGILIAPEPITRCTPMQRAAKGLVVTQMDMHPIEDLGLIKIDLLSNRSLGVLGECQQSLYLGVA